MWGQGDSVFGDNSLVPFYLWWGETMLKDEKVKYFVPGLDQMVHFQIGWHYSMFLLFCKNANRMTKQITDQVSDHLGQKTLKKEVYLELG